MGSEAIAIQSQVSIMGSAKRTFSQVLLDPVSSLMRSAGTPSWTAYAAIASASEILPRDEPPVKTTKPFSTDESDRTPISVRHRWIGCRRPSRLEGKPRTTIPQEPVAAALLAAVDLEALQCSNSAPPSATITADTPMASLAIIPAS